MKTQIIPEPIDVGTSNSFKYIVYAGLLAVAVLFLLKYIKTKKENEQKKISDSDNGSNEHAE